VLPYGYARRFAPVAREGPCARRGVSRIGEVRRAALRPAAELLFRPEAEHRCVAEVDATDGRARERGEAERRRSGLFSGHEGFVPCAAGRLSAGVIAEELVVLLARDLGRVDAEGSEAGHVGAASAGAAVLGDRGRGGRVDRRGSGRPGRARDPRSPRRADTRRGPRGRARRPRAARGPVPSLGSTPSGAP
jgi:hypothetical protein